MNYDGVEPQGIPEEVEVSGAERTTFYPEVERLAKQFNLAIKPDAHPEAGYYYRSDHFSLGRVGIPAFSISQGMKFKGHDLAWGEARAKDYVDNRYHKPADVFMDSWDFTGVAKLATFGYDLGQAAASSASEIKWLPGDEFDPAQQKLHSASIDGDALFAGYPELKPIHIEPIVYPPLARQTRIAGTVRVRVFVAENGSVGRSEPISGHALLLQAVSDAVRKWQFHVGVQREFELKFDFSFSGIPAYASQPVFEVREPLHLRLSIHPQPPYSTMSEVAVR